MPDSTQPHSTRPWRLVVGITVVAALVVSGVILVSRSRQQGSGQASAVDDASTSPAMPTTIKRPSVITDFVEPDNPSAVGVTVMSFTDLTRTTPARGSREALTTRPLTVVVRYPTVGMPGEDELVDAPPYEPAPLVLFAHGYDISTQRYQALLHDVAAAGFVVAAPEFPMASTVFDGAPDEYDIPEQARDLSFLITAMASPDSPTVLSGMVDPGPVAVMGHSDGAVTALLAGYAPRYADSRIAAVIAASGDFDTFGGAWFTTNDPPLLAIHGEYDEINPFGSSMTLVDNDPGEAMLVGVMEASHLGSVTDPATEPAVARLIAFDLRWRLGGSAEARLRTYAVASTPPLELVSG